MPDSHKNFAYSTVATAPSPATSGSSLVVASGAGTKFPAVSFNATVWPASTQPTTANAEIVRVTAISTDTFTITRAQESSSARSIVVGDQIAATATAKTLTDIETLSLDAWAAANATAADWSNNSHKITNLANGTAASDAATFGQVPPLTQSSSFPAADVSLSTTSFFDVCSLTLAAGTWVVFGKASFLAGTTAARSWQLKLWDGTTISDSAVFQVSGTAATANGALLVQAVVTPGSSTTYKISASTSVASPDTVKKNALASGPGTSLIAIRIA